MTILPTVRSQLCEAAEHVAREPRLRPLARPLARPLHRRREGWGRVSSLKM